MLRVRLIRGYDMYGIDLEAQENNWNGERLPIVGQIVLHDNKRAKVCAIDGIQVCLVLNESTGLILCNIKYLKPIPNPAETAKQKAIDEMVGNMPANQRNKNRRAAEFLYHAGYTKSKVKPLSYEQYGSVIDRDTHYKADYELLIAEGYCIGSEG